MPTPQCVTPCGVLLQLVVMQFRVPVVEPLTIPTDPPLTVNFCCQSSVQLPPWVQVEEQLSIVSGGVVPVLSVVHVLGFGSWPHALLVVQTPLVHESCSATLMPEMLMADLLEPRT